MRKVAIKFAAAPNDADKTKLLFVIVFVFVLVFSGISKVAQYMYICMYIYSLQ